MASQTKMSEPTAGGDPSSGFVTRVVKAKLAGQRVGLSLYELQDEFAASPDGERFVALCSVRGFPWSENLGAETNLQASSVGRSHSHRVMSYGVEIVVAKLRE